MTRFSDAEQCWYTKSSRPDIGNLRRGQSEEPGFEICIDAN